MKENDTSAYVGFGFSKLTSFQVFIRMFFSTVRSTRLDGRISGLETGFMSVGVWFVVAGTGWRFRGKAPEDLGSPLKQRSKYGDIR